MGVSVKNLNRLVKKIDKLTNVKTKEVVKQVADNMLDEISKKGNEISDDKAGDYVGYASIRDYGLSCYMDVGFNSELYPFASWKSLWFQQWGFNDYGLNFTGQYYINNHKGWFDEAINTQEEKAIKALKQKTHEKIKEALK